MIHDAFAETVYADRLKDIESILKAGTSPRIIYLDSLRRFGRKSGQEVYRMLKECTGL